MKNNHLLLVSSQDKKYATDKYKDIYTELSIVRAKAERDLGRLREQLQQAHDALGEPTLEDVERGGYGTALAAANTPLKHAACSDRLAVLPFRHHEVQEQS